MFEGEGKKERKSHNCAMNYEDSQTWPFKFTLVNLIK